MAIWKKRRDRKRTWRGLPQDLPQHKQQNLALHWRMTNLGSLLMGWVSLSISWIIHWNLHQGDVQRCEEHYQPRFRDLLWLAACAGAFVRGCLWGLLHDPGSQPTCKLGSQIKLDTILFSGYREEGGAEAQRLAHHFPGPLVFFLDSLTIKTSKALCYNKVFLFSSDDLLIGLGSLVKYVAQP